MFAFFSDFVLNIICLCSVHDEIDLLLLSFDDVCHVNFQAFCLAPYIIYCGQTNILQNTLYKGERS